MKQPKIVLDRDEIEKYLVNGTYVVGSKSKNDGGFVADAAAIVYVKIMHTSSGIFLETENHSKSMFLRF